jgi:hypothetical protein
MAKFSRSFPYSLKIIRFSTIVALFVAPTCQQIYVNGKNTMSPSLHICRQTYI